MEKKPKKHAREAIGVQEQKPTMITTTTNTMKKKKSSNYQRDDNCLETVTDAAAVVSVTTDKLKHQKSIERFAADGRAISDAVKTSSRLTNRTEASDQGSPNINENRFSNQSSSNSFVLNEAHRTSISAKKSSPPPPPLILSTSTNIDKTPADVRTSRESIAPEVNDTVNLAQNSSTPSTPTTPKLVFGLHSRTNRLRHNEYAAERRSHVSQMNSSIVENNKQNINQTKFDGDSHSEIPSSNKTQASDLNEAQQQAEQQASQIKQTKTKKKSTRSNSPSRSSKFQQASTSNPSTEGSRTNDKVDKDELIVVENTATSKMVSKKQPSTIVTSTSDKHGGQNAGQSHNTDIMVDQTKNNQSPKAPIKMQFNIPPPPPSKLTSNKSSLVSYAKARIYDKQPPIISSNILPPGTTLTTSGGASASLSSSATLNNLSSSIVAGFKPPKQVDVRKAREKWEGGEPFAKCKSRQRLAATQAGKKHQLHGSWSMTSVVATQQMQLQQALAQSASRGQKPGFHSGDDMPVKILSRGSVLERVQKFESAPSPGELAEAGFGVTPPETLNLDILSANKLDAATAKDTCFVESPVAGLTTDQYLSTLNNNIRKTLEELRLSGSSTSSTANGSPLQSPLAADSPRRLSFRRRSSASSLNLLASKIPKFYHPNGKPNTYEIELQRRNIVACFDKFPDRKAALVGPNCRRHFHQIALACGFSEYFKEPLLLYARHLEPTWSQERVSHTLGRKQSSFDRLPNTIGTRKLSTGIHPISNKTSISRSASKPTLTRANSIDVGRSVENQENQNGSSPDSLIPKFITCDQYFVCWRHIIEHAYDNSARFIHLLTFGQRNYLLPDDFIPLIQSIIDNHPGLRFLGQAPDFHMRYIQTVIARIYFNINKSWTGKISQAELRHSNLIDVLHRVSQTEDINEITDYFSYEHFYVIYCKFWSLDQDHDLEISKEDLIRHNDASISSRIIERIFMGIVSKHIQERGKMGYSDFVWFLIAEEDKKHPRSIEYWFRLMDIDGDGYISMYEMEYFYFEQMKRLELMSIEPLPFVDCACQMLDLVNPKEKNRISLSDLKRTKMVTIFFDTFINLEKYLEHESREFVSTRDVIINGKIVSDWDRYASQEYESLISEETTV